MAVVWDFYKGKIPNILILAGFVVGVINVIYSYGVIAFMSRIPGIIFPVILLFPLYKIGTIGAGDIKLFSLLGIYFSFMETLFCIFCAFLIGAMISFIVLLWHKNFKERMLHLGYYLKDCLSIGHFRYYYLDLNHDEKIGGNSGIHFSLPILLSVLSYLCK